MRHARVAAHGVKRTWRATDIARYSNLETNSRRDSVNCFLSSSSPVPNNFGWEIYYLSPKMSKATTLKKFVLVSLDSAENPKNITRKMRRYLNGNKLNHIFTSNIEDMREFLDKAHDQAFSEESTEMRSDTPPIDFENKPIISLSSNQEMLEKWARETFSPDSMEMNLLFGTPAAPGDNDDEDESNSGNSPRDNDIDDDMELDIWGKEVPKIFSTHSVDLDSTFENKKDDAPEILQICMACEKNVDVGKNRNTKVRRQAMHVFEQHAKPTWTSINIQHRYQCNRCYKFVSVGKSPCEHITEYHAKEEVDTEFSDLWEEGELKEFNDRLAACFGRTLPIPRSKDRNGQVFSLPSKIPCRSKQEEHIVPNDPIANSDEDRKDTEKVSPENEEEHKEEKEEVVEVQVPMKSNDEASEDVIESDDVVVVGEVRTVNHDHDYYLDDYEAELYRHQQDFNFDESDDEQI